MADPETTPHVETWTDTNGLVHTVTTPRSVDESVHLRRVAAAKAKFPEAPQ